MIRTFLTWMGIALIEVGLVQAAGQEPTNPASRAALQYSAVINRYCVTCHNEELRTAELVLSMLNVENVRENTAVWEEVLLKLRAGEMPPVGMPRPNQATVDSFVAYLETELDRTTEAGAGRLAVHPPESADQQAGLQPLSLTMGRDFRGLLDPFDSHLETAELLRELCAGATSLSGPVGRCVKGRFNLEFSKQKK